MRTLDDHISEVFGDLIKETPRGLSGHQGLHHPSPATGNGGRVDQAAERARITDAERDLKNYRELRRRQALAAAMKAASARKVRRRDEAMAELRSQL